MSAIELPDSLDDILEAALLAAAEPLSLERLESLFDENERPARRALREALLRVEGRHQTGAMELLETAPAINCVSGRGSLPGSPVYGTSAPSAIRGRCSRPWH
ncbi:hypothetical protein Q427_05675 [Halomonas sp. BC04]|nr:hypothetical protein Q427_05675 [Halomonas sp. BC04]